MSVSKTYVWGLSISLALTLPALALQESDKEDSYPTTTTQSIPVDSGGSGILRRPGARPPEPGDEWEKDETDGHWYYIDENWRKPTDSQPDAGAFIFADYLPGSYLPL